MTAELRLANPPIEVDEIGMIALDDLSGAGEPVVHVGLRYVGEVVRQVTDVAVVSSVELRWPVEAGDGIDSPVNEDAELRIAKPFRRLIRAETLPVIAKRTCGYGLVDVGEDALALAIVFAIRHDPLRIGLLRR